MTHQRIVTWSVFIVSCLGTGACTKREKTVVTQPSSSPTAQATAGISHDLADLSLKTAASSFVEEIKHDCLQLKEEISGEQVVSSFVTSNGGRYQIRIDQPLTYDAEKSICTGKFTITDPARGFSHSFSVPSE